LRLELELSRRKRQRLHALVMAGNGEIAALQPNIAGLFGHLPHIFEKF
jgi:hypothetical protein